MKTIPEKKPNYEDFIQRYNGYKDEINRLSVRWLQEKRDMGAAMPTIYYYVPKPRELARAMELAAKMVELRRRQGDVVNIDSFKGVDEQMLPLFKLILELSR